MYNNRHCIEKDLIHITTLIKRFVSYLDNENIEAMSFAITLEKEIENFDSDIARRFHAVITNAKKFDGHETFIYMREKCQPLFDELTANIVVDIKEHNN